MAARKSGAIGRGRRRWGRGAAGTGSACDFVNGRTSSTFCCSRRMVSALVMQPLQARQSLSVIFSVSRSPVFVKPQGVVAEVAARLLARSFNVSMPSISSLVWICMILMRRGNVRAGSAATRPEQTTPNSQTPPSILIARNCA